jgi:tight adherence protein C
MLFIALAALFVGLAVFLLAEVVTLPARERAGSIRRAVGYGRVRSASTDVGDRAFKERALVPLAAGLARAALRVTPRASMESVGLKLLRAGLGRKVSPTAFLASKAGLALGAFLLVLVTAGPSSRGILFGFVFAGVAFMFPDVFLTYKTRSRKEALSAELPDTLDLLAVSVEAGLGFDAAIAKVNEHMDGPLSEEFALTLGEVRIGESRQNALQKMVRRVDTPEFSAFVRAVIQADQLGISLGRILKVQAEDSRERRQLAAEEKAQKAPIKMLFPTVLFIFPALFVVVLGPALLNIGEIF